MSRLDDIFAQHPQLVVGLYKGEPVFTPNTALIKREIKDLLQKLVDDTVMGLGGDVPYGELSEKIEQL